MESISISLNNVSKKYRLFHSRMDRLKETLHPFRKKFHTEFWALKNITFNIQKGETVGIVGRNGSGKSSLLQLICSILKPNEGEIEVNGRISALLELGAGFNPDFTGRENALLNGAIMGIPLKEMEQRMPLVANFADIGDYFDQPVRFYSSGMFMRLAFASAINVDPEILIIDEALAVGDAKFQHKCFQKFNEFKKDNKTIILVSHDTQSIVNLCDEALLLDNGNLIEKGKPKNIVNYYLDLVEGRKIKNGATEIKQSAHSSSPKSACLSAKEPSESDLNQFLIDLEGNDLCSTRKSYNKNEYRQGFSKAEIIDYFIVNEDKNDPTFIFTGDKIDLYVKVRYHSLVDSPVFGLAVKNIEGILLFGYNTFFGQLLISPAEQQDILTYRFSITMNLAPGEFYIDLGTDAATTENIIVSLDRRCSIIHLTVKEEDHFDGLVKLETTFQEVMRNGHAVENKPDL